MKIKFNLLLVDERNTATTVFFFKQYCSDRCVIVAEKMADVFIINMDHPQAQVEYKRIKREFPQKICVLMALHQPVNVDYDYYLEKPIIASRFLNIVDELEKKILFREVSQRTLASDLVQQQVTSKENKTVKKQKVSKKIASAHAADLLTQKDSSLFSTKSIKVTVPEKQNKPSLKTFKLDEYILGAIYRAYTTACESKEVVKLSGLWRPIYFFPDTHEVYIDLSYSQLRSVCATPIMSQSDTLVPREIKIEKSKREWELKHCQKAERFRPIENFMWKVALFTARGRIPDFVNPKQVIHLNSWPNLTRLDLTPDIVKLIAFWSTAKHSLDDAIEQLNVRQKDTYALFTALYILGHISYSGGQVQSYKIQNKTSEALPSQTKNMLAKLVTKLKIAW